MSIGGVRGAGCGMRGAGCGMRDAGCGARVCVTERPGSDPRKGAARGLTPEGLLHIRAPRPDRSAPAGEKCEPAVTPVIGTDELTDPFPPKCARMRWRWPQSARKARMHAVLLAVVLWTALIVTFAAGPGNRSISGTIKGPDFLQFYTI